MPMSVTLSCKYPGCTGHVKFNSEAQDSGGIPVFGFKLFYHISPDEDVMFSLLDDQGHKVSHIEDKNLLLREVEPDTFGEHSLTVKESNSGSGSKEYILPFSTTPQTHTIYLTCDNVVTPHSLPYDITY